MQLPAPQREEEKQIIEMLKSSFYQGLVKIIQEEAALLRFPSSPASYYQQAPTQVTALGRHPPFFLPSLGPPPSSLFSLACPTPTLEAWEDEGGVLKRPRLLDRLEHRPRRSEL